MSLLNKNIVEVTKWARLTKIDQQISLVDDAHYMHRGSLEGAFTNFFLCLNLFSEAVHLIVNTFVTSSNGLEYLNVNNSESAAVKNNNVV